MERLAPALVFGALAAACGGPPTSVPVAFDLASDCNPTMDAQCAVRRQVTGLVFASADGGEGTEVLYADFTAPNSALGILEIAWPAKGPGDPSVTYREVARGKLVFAGKTVVARLDVGSGRDPVYGAFAFIAVDDGPPRQVRAIARGRFGELRPGSVVRVGGGSPGDVGIADWLDIDVYIPPDPEPLSVPPSDPATTQEPSPGTSAPDTTIAAPDLAAPSDSGSSDSGSGCSGDNSNSSTSSDSSSSSCSSSDSGSGSGSGGCEGDASAASLEGRPRAASRPLRGLAQFLWPMVVAGAFNRRFRRRWAR
jgi:hypothetical protein